MLAALLAVLRALARLGLRHGVACQQFIALTKRAYLDVALSDDFAVAGRKTTLSRAAVLTGLTRKEIQRLAAEPGGTLLVSRGVGGSELPLRLFADPDILLCDLHAP